MYRALLFVALAITACSGPPVNEFDVAAASCQHELAQARKGEPSYRTIFGAPRYTPGYRALTAGGRIDMNTVSPINLGSLLQDCSQATVLANRAQAAEDAADMRMIARQNGFPVPYRINPNGRIN